jgi:CRP-like cAMP-binding protein
MAQAGGILEASVFAAVPASARDALLGLGKLERLPRRHRIAHQGEAARAFALIGSGRVKLERIRDGRAFPVAHRGPGEMVGETAILSGGAAAENAIVADEVEALLFALGPFRKLLAIESELRAAMMLALVAQRRAAETRLEALLLHGVEARVAEFLLQSLSRWGRAHPLGELIEAPFTHADIALLVGSTRETVTLLLGKLKRASLIDFERRRVVIRDRDALARHAAGF